MAAFRAVGRAIAAIFMVGVLRHRRLRCERTGDSPADTLGVPSSGQQALFVPEWIRSLSAPQSPAEWQEQITWHYGQGGPSVFFGDVAFYSGDWDARERIGRIDTNRCRLFMLTGEYDYSCTVEMSEATAAKIPGAAFREMRGIGHFPFAENPALFAEYLLPVLRALRSE